ncbi:MAG: AAA family ATPase [Acidimicrobiaceae bacterium]|nr:AAA family ATPase [Acidimicrobiaceae bacterium]MCY4279491.1 AAA family ATPase [Acidimicrobiaceae bacterium]
MLESISIKNYRGFKDCLIGDFGRINIFAGMNNSGKTTLLEALFLWSAAGNPQSAFNPILVRVDVPVERVPIPGPVPSVMPGAGYMWSTAWQPMFHALGVETPIEIVGTHGSYGALKLNISTEQSDELVISSNTDTSNGFPDDLIFRFGNSDKSDPCEIRIKTSGAGYDIRTNGEIEVPLQSVFVSMHDIAIDIERLSRLKKEKADDSVLKAIQMVDSSVNSIEIGVFGNHVIILADIGLEDRLPLQALGVGPQRAASLATNAATAAGGLLLIDEFDAGLHHSKIGDVWKALHAIAVDRNVQVFATTHSYECVRAAAEFLDDDEPHFYRLQDGSATSYPPDVLADAITAQMEVRG